MATTRLDGLARIGVFVLLLLVAAVVFPGLVWGYGDAVPANGNFGVLGGWTCDTLDYGCTRYSAGHAGNNYVILGNTQGYAYSSAFRSDTGATFSVWHRCSDFCGSGKPIYELIDYTAGTTVVLTDTVGVTSTWSQVSVVLPTVSVNNNHILALRMKTGGGGTWTDMTEVAVTNSWNFTGSYLFNGSFNSNASNWVYVGANAPTNSAFVWESVAGNNAPGSLVVSGDSGYHISFPIVASLGNTSWSIKCNGSPNSVVWVEFADLTNQTSWDARNDATVNCSAGWTNLNLAALTVGHTYMWRTRFNSNGGGNLYIDDLCPNGNCVPYEYTPTPTATPTSAATSTATPTATPTATWTPIGNVGINWSQFPTVPPYLTQIAPLTQIPYPTQIAPLTQIPYLTQVPYPTQYIPSPTPSPTMALKSTMIAINSSSASFPTYPRPGSSGTIGFAAPGESNASNPFDIQFGQDDYGGTLPLDAIGLPSITFIIHLIYPSALIFGGVNVLGAVQGIAAAYLFVFILRRLQKR